MAACYTYRDVKHVGMVATGKFVTATSQKMGEAQLWETKFHNV